MERQKIDDEQARKEQEAKARANTPEIADALKFVFYVIAKRAGPHWELEDVEAERLAYRLARVEQKYGGMLDRYACEVALVVSAAMVVGPRLLIEVEKADGKKVEAGDVTAERGEAAGAPVARA